MERGSLARFQVMMSVGSLLSAMLLLVGTATVNATGIQTWRDRWNLNNTISFGTTFYKAWQTQEIFLGYNNDNLEVDGDGNSFALQYQGDPQKVSIVSFDPNGNVRFTFREPGVHRYYNPVISMEGKVAFFVNGTFYLLDNDGRMIFTKYFPESSYPSLPIFQGSDEILFTMVDDHVRTLYNISAVDGKLLSETSLGSGFGFRKVLPGAGRDLVLIADQSVACISRNGDMRWTKDYFRGLVDSEIDEEGRTYIATVYDVHCIDAEGIEVWNRTYDENTDIWDLKVDREGNLLVLLKQWAHDFGGQLHKFGRDGELIWMTDCVYAHKEPVIDKDGNIVIGGIQKMEKRGNDGDLIAYLHKEELFYFSDVVILNETTFLVTDCKSIVCLRELPYRMDLRTSESILDGMKLQIDIKDMPALSHPVIDSIEVTVINKDFEGVDRSYSGEVRTVSIPEPPRDPFKIMITLILENGERIAGPSINASRMDRTAYYVSIWFLLSIFPITIMAIVIIAIYRRRAKKEKPNGS